MTVIEDEQTGSLAARLQSISHDPVWAMTEDQLKTNLVEALRVRAGLDALVAQLLVAADQQNLPTLQGCASTTTWLAHLAGISRYEARKVVTPSECLSEVVEETRAAWSTGTISTEQATIICQAVTGLPDFVGEQERRVAEKFLLDASTRFDLHDLKRLANHILEVIDPDGAEEHAGNKLEEEEKRARLKTSLSMHHAGEGLTRGRFLLPDVQAGMLRSLLEGLASPRRNSPAVYDRDGDHCDAANGTLTHDMRLGRALCELIEHLPTGAMPHSPKHSVQGVPPGGLAATVTINLDFEKLKDGLGTAVLSTGDEMSASQARRFACNAQLIPVVLDGKSKVLDLGLSKRLHTRYQRIAITHRDNGCVWAGCDRPASFCEVHHPHWWSKGGPTDLNNGALFCHYHHHLLHNGEWDAHIGADGIPEVIPPPRIDPHQKPMRHARLTKRLLT